MYTMIPFNARREFSRHRPAFPFDDRFFRSFFDLNDRMGNMGFRVDIHDEETHYLLEAELPGVPQDQIQITADHDTLTITADIQSQRKSENACYSERRMGHVSRTFNLDGIDENAITAAYENGVLTVTLPKEKPAKPAGQRRIPIGGADQG